jgi:hypothetical protein
MTNNSQFHDGLFKGFLIDGTNVRVYQSNAEGVRFDAVATGVIALIAGGFRAGNIILDVLVLDSAEVTKQHIELYDLRPDVEGERQKEQLIAQVRQENLSLLEINPSYGGQCVILARSIEITTAH